MITKLNSNRRIRDRAVALIALLVALTAVSTHVPAQTGCTPNPTPFTDLGAMPSVFYIAREIKGNWFLIAGGRAGKTGSWPVTGIRRDAYVKAHRIQVEADKPPHERGRYSHPEVCGAHPLIL